MDSYKKGQRAYDKKDYVKAVSFWKPLAEQGHIEAINSMGDLYATEDYIPTCLPEDYAQASYYFKQGTLRGNAHSMYRLGLLYHDGLGVKKDKNRARDLFRKAAEKEGHSGAAYALATSQYHNEYNPDYKEAHYWYLVLVEAGLTSAHFFLADMYMNGYGVKKDYVEAYKHLILAGIVPKEDLKDINEQGLESSDLYYRVINKGVSILHDQLRNLLNSMEINTAKHLAAEFKKKKG